MALDPADQHLRHVEKDILIPKIMREKAKERCSEQVQVQINFCETLQMLDGFGRIFCRISQTKRRNLYSYINSNFTKCCKNSGVLMVVKCRKENSALKECLTAYYDDPAFYEECKMEYLKEREEFRKTGIPTKKRLQKVPTSM
ncbi:PREDICTED: COX assembly mitochondrial protein homolog isoform X1 [Colobus angolensis palliatus]|uniref:COX assembly mitochondrial protein homolog isoform X1 n=1 Tax=Colobus angolensis palliatus TaxID=336983 RepID=UPI0005F4BF19|nr:PREDICTED: COX assembly mitochondrial protein homolog isoform X1 [Colobus angolensis palliatus]